MNYEDLTLEELQLQNKKLTIISGLVHNLLEIEAAAIPEIMRSYSFSVTEKQVCLDSTVIPAMPFIGFQVANDGPDDVYCWINEIRNIKEQVVEDDTLHNIAPLKHAPILVGETMKFSMGFSGVRKIYLQCNVGDNTVIRIFSEGKRPVLKKEGDN